MAPTAIPGEGGWLEELRARPASGGPATREPPHVAAIVLAAGMSSRMAPQNKLLIADASGRPMIVRVVDATLASQADPVIVVTGHQAEEVAAVLAGHPVRLVHAADHAAGLSTSLRAGIGTVPDFCDAALICLGDMPLVSGETLDRMIAHYDRSAGRQVIVPVFRGTRGNPVLWDRRFFAAMAALRGDTGARDLRVRHEACVSEVEILDNSVLRDFDTPETVPAESTRNCKPTPFPG